MSNKFNFSYEILFFVLYAFCFVDLFLKSNILPGFSLLYVIVFSAFLVGYIIYLMFNMNMFNTLDE